MSLTYRLDFPPAPPPKIVPKIVTRDVSSGASVVVAVGDCVETQVTLTAVLPDAAMKETLKEVAIRAGWKVAPCDPSQLQLDSEEVEVTLDLNRMVVVAKVKTTETITNEARTKITAAEDAVDAKAAVAAKRLDAQVAAKTAAEASAKKEELEVLVSDKLTKTEGRRKEALNELLKQTYVEAVKKKAAALGAITSVRESKQGDDFELVIKISE